MVLRRTFQRSFLPMARLLFVMAVAAQRAAASASPPSYAGTGVINNAGFYAATSLAAASMAAGGYQYAFVDYAGSGNYAGAPGGWTQVCTAKGAASIAVFAHLNGANEPASNTWGVGGTVGGVYAIAIGAVTNSAGIDGSICSAPGNGASTITIGTPNIGSSGASDFTATWATVSGSAGSLIFSGPNNQSVWAPGANAAEGYYYTGVPVAVTYTNGSGTPHFSPLAAQIAFLPLGAAPTPTPTAAATPTPSTTATPTPTPTTTIITTPTPTLTATPSPSATPVSTPSAIQFDGRTQGNTNASATNVIVTTPASVRDGDYLLVTIDSWNSTLAAPSSWTALSNTANEVSNGAGDHIALVYRVWHTGDPTSYSLGSSNLNYPKAVLRAYNGVGGIDRFACSPAAGTVTTAPSFTLSALPVTQSAGEEFVAAWASDYIPALINGPSDLGDGKADNTQWATFDGDKPIPATGTVPTTETANSASGSPNWIGCDATLISIVIPPTPSPVSPTPVPTASPTPNGAASDAGRVQNSFSGTSAVGINPTGAQVGDWIACVSWAYNSSPSAPTGFNEIGPFSNSNGDESAFFTKPFAAGDTLYTFGVSNFPKIICRIVRNSGGLDEVQHFTSSAPNAPSALPAISSSGNDLYDGFCGSDNGPVPGPTDLTGTADTTQWATFDGVKTVSAGTIPADNCE